MNHYINISKTGTYDYGQILELKKAPSLTDWRLLEPDVIKRIKQGNIHNNLCLLLSYFGTVPHSLPDLGALNKVILEDKRFYIWMSPDSAMYNQGSIYRRRSNDVSESFHLIPKDITQWNDKQRFIDYVRRILSTHKRISKVYSWEDNVNWEIFKEH